MQTLDFLCETAHYVGKFKGKVNLVRHRKSQNIMTMILGFHQAINNDFWRYLEITFRRYLAIILKIYVRFTLKEQELRCAFSSSFDIISGSEEGGILFRKQRLCLVGKKKNESQRKHQVPEFFHKQAEKRPLNSFNEN